MTKPKGKTPSLISQSTGKPVADVLKKKCKCNRCKSELALGERCFRIPKMESGFSNKKPYCINCFRDILEQTKKDISEIERSLNSNMGQ